MGLFEKLKIPFGQEDRTFKYECMNCGTTFESEHADMSKVSCGECGAARVRALSSR